MMETIFYGFAIGITIVLCLMLRDVCYLLYKEYSSFKKRSKIIKAGFCRCNKCKDVVKVIDDAREWSFSIAFCRKDGAIAHDEVSELTRQELIVEKL